MLFIKSMLIKLKPKYKRALKIIIIIEQERKVKTTPSDGRRSFSSITPKSELGSKNITE